VIEYVPNLDDLLPREQHWMDALFAAHPQLGLNRAPTAGSPRGMKRSDEAKAKVSAANKGRKLGPLSAAHKAKVSASKKGQPSKLRGRPQAIAHSRAIAAARRGKPDPRQLRLL
jgi:hypothetical protein